MVEKPGSEQRMIMKKGCLVHVFSTGAELIVLPVAL
jgi:hypothetical protein